MKIKRNLTKILSIFSLLALITSQQLDTKTNNQVQATPTDRIAQTQETNIPSRQNRVVIIVFTGFASSYVGWVKARNPTQPTVTFLTSTQLLNC